MLKRRLAILAAAAVTIGSATVLAALVVGSAPVPTTAAAVSSRSAAGVVRIAHRGLVKDCVHIEDQDGPYNIQGQGVNNPVTLSAGSGSCFNLYNKFQVVFGTTVYTGYEYQDLSGHCLWDNGGTIDVGGACRAGHPNEDFFGIEFVNGSGWEVGDVTRGPGVYMTGAPSGDHVIMSSSFVTFWNFPS